MPGAIGCTGQIRFKRPQHRLWSGLRSKVAKQNHMTLCANFRDWPQEGAIRKMRSVTCTAFSTEFRFGLQQSRRSSRYGWWTLGRWKFSGKGCRCCFRTRCCKHFWGLERMCFDIACLDQWARWTFNVFGAMSVVTPADLTSCLLEAGLTREGWSVWGRMVTKSNATRTLNAGLFRWLPGAQSLGLQITRFYGTSLSPYGANTVSLNILSWTWRRP